MEYLQRFYSRLGLQNIGNTDSLSSLIVKVFAYFVEFVEAQVNFLHHANNLFTSNSITVLAKYLLGYAIPIDFNTPATIRIRLTATSTTPISTNEATIPKGTLLTVSGANLYVAETVTIPAYTGANLSFELDVYSLLPEVTVSIIDQNSMAFTKLPKRGTYSKSVIVEDTNGYIWQNLSKFNHHIQKVYVTTLNEKGEPILLFPNEKPTYVNVTYQELGVLNFSNGLVTNDPILEYDALQLSLEVLSTDLGTYAALPTVSNIRSAVRNYFRTKGNYTLEEVINEVRSAIAEIEDITTRGLTAYFVDNSTLLITSKTKIPLYQFDKLVQDRLTTYKKLTNLNVIVKLVDAVQFNLDVTVYGTVTKKFDAAIKEYILKSYGRKSLGDLYEIIEKSISGTSRITKAAFSPIATDTNSVGMVFNIVNSTLTDQLNLILVATSSTTYALFDENGNQLISSEFGVQNTITVNNNTLQFYCVSGGTSYGITSTISLLPDLTRTGFVETNFNYEVSTINITTV